MKIITEIEFDYDSGNGIVDYTTKDITSGQLSTNQLELNTLSHDAIFRCCTIDYYKSLIDNSSGSFISNNLYVIFNIDDKYICKTTIVDYTKNETYILEYDNNVQNLLELQYKLRNVLICINKIYKNDNNK